MADNRVADDQLSAGAARLGLPLSEAQRQQFSRYSQELQRWNTRINLTRITDPAEIETKHFLDSLSIYPALAGQPHPLALIDIGSGAGFPGLPLKITLPRLRLTLVESVGKKARFLEHIIDTLQLEHVTVLSERIEAVGRQPEHREQYDIAVARAVAALPVLAEYTLPLVKIGGRVIAQKGQDPTQEIKDAAAAIKLLGGELSQSSSVTVPGVTGQRHLVILTKAVSTPARFPRRAGLPTKKPLKGD